MNEWMKEGRNERLREQTNECMRERTNACIHEFTNECLNTQMKEWRKEGRLKARMIAQMKEWMKWLEWRKVQQDAAWQHMTAEWVSEWASMGYAAMSRKRQLGQPGQSSCISCLDPEPKFRRHVTDAFSLSSFYTLQSGVWSQFWLVRHWCCHWCHTAQHWQQTPPRQVSDGSPSACD